MASWRSRQVVKLALCLFVHAFTGTHDARKNASPGYPGCSGVRSRSRNPARHGWRCGHRRLVRLEHSTSGKKRCLCFTAKSQLTSCKERADMRVSSSQLAFAASDASQRSKHRLRREEPTLTTGQGRTESHAATFERTM